MHPHEINDYRKALITDVVYEVFNSLIALNWNTELRSATFPAKVVKDQAVKRLKQENKEFKEGMLNVKEIYEDLGWRVKYKDLKQDGDTWYVWTFSKPLPPRD